MIGAGAQQGPALHHRVRLPVAGDLAGAPPIPPHRQGVSPHRPRGYQAYKYFFIVSKYFSARLRSSGSAAPSLS